MKMRLALWCVCVWTVYPLCVSAEDGEKRKCDYFFYEGLKLKYAGKLDEAFETFRYCWAMDSTDAALAYELAFCYAQLEEPEKMLALLKQATTGSPANFTYLWVYTSVARSLGYREDAAASIRQLLRHHPHRLELNRYLAELLAEEGEYEEAIATYNVLESGSGMREDISLQKYRLYMQLNNKEAAFGEIERLAGHFSRNIRYTLLLGDLYLEAGDLPHAYESYLRVERISPNAPQYLISLSNYYEATGDHASADSCLQAALTNPSLDPEDKVDILSRYLVRSRVEKEDDVALSLLDTLIRQHPETTNFRLMYGSLLAIRGDHEEAYHHFRAVTEIEPDNAPAWKNLLRVAFGKEDNEEILRICSTCIRLFPEEPEYYFYLGFYYHQQKDYASAVRTCRQGLATVLDDNPSLKVEFYGQIGDSYYLSGQPDSAFQAYEQALSLDETNLSVLNNYAYFLALAHRDLDRAERMSALTVKAEPNNATYLDTYAWIFFVKGDYRLALLYIGRAIDNDKTNNPELLEHRRKITEVTNREDNSGNNQ
jgi:tetratricopeptide (TPR) repeat protein